MVRLSSEEQFSLLLRLLRNTVEKVDTGCLIRTTSRQSRGYTTISIKGKNYLAHRVVYALVKGRLEEFEEVLHSCDTPACLEPNHLFKGSHADNHDDMRSKGRAYVYGKWLPPKEFSIDGTDS